MKDKIYESSESELLSLSGLIDIYNKLGVRKILFKYLAPNDNSKNQPYLAPHISELSFMPTGSFFEEPSSSQKTNDIKRKIRYKASLNFGWLASDSRIYPALETKIIYYPQYPEVRLSGFLKGCNADISKWMNEKKFGRSEGRILFFGIHPDNRIIAWLATPESRIAREINNAPAVKISSVFSCLAEEDISTRSLLIKELQQIHAKGGISGKRMNNRKEILPYSAPNAGGYTLEAELGIAPNGYAEPDFHGWEVKQFGVKGFAQSVASKPLTLMTPQPDGGVYVENGILFFLKKYGYSSLKKFDRYDFNGCHYFNKSSKKTNLILCLNKFDIANGKITESDGSLLLKDENDNVVASWSFHKLLEHWKKKHNKAVYVPSVKEKVGSALTYKYGNLISLYSGTSFEKLLRAISLGYIYLDPACRVNNISTKPDVKHRWQFRIKHKHLHYLYNDEEMIDILLN